MIITYKIPSGTMHINMREFFKLARRSAIRRMFKQLRQDDKAAAEYTSQIREHLKKREQEERDEAARLYGELVDAGTQCREAKVRYEEMQNPFCECYTRDKKVLEAAKPAVKKEKAVEKKRVYLKQAMKTEIDRLYTAGKEIEDIAVAVGADMAAVSRYISTTGLPEKRYKGMKIPSPGSVPIGAGSTNLTGKKR